MSRRPRQTFGLLALCAALTPSPATAQPAAKVPPVPQDPAAQQKQREATMKWYRGEVVEAYEKVGNKNPKWDAPARAALEALTEYWAAPNRTEERRQKAQGLLQKAIEAGCDDPMVRYGAARLDPAVFKNSDPNSPFFKAAADLGRSKYPALRRCHALSNLAVQVLTPSKLVDQARPGEKARATARGYLDTTVSLLPAALESPTGKALDEVVSVMRPLLTGYRMLEGDRKVGFDKVKARLGTNAKYRHALQLIEGVFWIDYAWDARGGGAASTVTEEGRKQFSSRLTRAEQVLAAAWKAAPNDPVAPTEMLKVATGLGFPRSEMWTWFERAMTADGDNTDAVDSALTLLEPKWGGSPEEMLAFGRACLKTENWEAGLPLTLVTAHDRLVRGQGVGVEYFDRPQVWDDIRSVYEPYLKKYPDARSARAKYGWWAYHCRRHQEAHKQFEQLGDSDWEGVFSSKESFDRIRAVARERATKK